MASSIWSVNGDCEFARADMFIRTHDQAKVERRAVDEADAAKRM